MTKLIIPVILTMLLMPAFSQSTAEWKWKALQGDSEAQVLMGMAYQMGDAEGYGQNYFEAVKWYRMAAEMGNTAGQFNLGQMYFHGRGVSINRVQAHKWCNLSASVRDNRYEDDHKGGSVMSETLKSSIECRESAASGMSIEEINEAQRLAAEWKPKPWEVIRKELKIE